MFNVKCHKLLLTAATISTLAGCQSSSIDFDAIRQASNATASPQGKALGGGFVAGMTPQQACIYFHDFYKTKKNTLCAKAGAADFTELTIVNKNIVKSPDSKNPVDTIAFYFDQNSKLFMVQAVADNTDDENNKNKTNRNISDAYSGSIGN